MPPSESDDAEREAPPTMTRHRWLDLVLGISAAVPLAAYLVLAAVGPAVSAETAQAALEASRV
jgi:hypothetical protein